MACWGTEHREPAQITLGLALLVTTCVFLARDWPNVRPLLVRTGQGCGATWLGLALLVPLLDLNSGYHHLLMEAFESQRPGSLSKRPAIFVLQNAQTPSRI